MAEAMETTKRIAKAKYAAKVCVGYLGVSPEACNRLFEKLYKNMKTTYEQIAKA